MNRGFFCLDKSRKHGVFSMGNARQVNPKASNNHWIPIDYALEIVFKQMNIAGNRPRTIDSYDYIFRGFCEANKILYVEEITIDTIYSYLEGLDVSQQTKKIRLKTIKAVLGKFYFNDWLKDKFWLKIQIKVDTEVKAAAKEGDILKLVHFIDKSTFIGFRDVTAILLMYRTGIRIHTLCELKERHIDFEHQCLNLDGSTLKNHKFLKLPLDDELTEMLQLLIKQNKKIRQHYKINNQSVFITQNGLSMSTSKSSNCAISKQLNKYSKRFGLENINPHAIRRGYAKNLLDKGASVPLISKALGHSDLAVTTQYLDLNVEEVARSLKDYL